MYANQNTHTTSVLLLAFCLDLPGSVLYFVGLLAIDVSSGVDTADRKLWVSALMRQLLEFSDLNIVSSTCDILAVEPRLSWGTIPGVGLAAERQITF